MPLYYFRQAADVVQGHPIGGEPYTPFTDRHVQITPS